jgi:PhnB protein
MSDSPVIPPITPHLTVSDARAAIRFYQLAFDATETNRMEADDGRRLLHAALALNGSMVMLCDDFPEFNSGRRRAPGPEGGTGVTIHLNVADVDAVMAQAVAAGATALMEAADMFWGQRYGKLRDPFGHEWSVGGPPAVPQTSSPGLNG